jgi:hypothetical protein
MQKWEYREVQFEGSGNHGVLLSDTFSAGQYAHTKRDDKMHVMGPWDLCMQYLNELGEDGWEIISAQMVYSGEGAHAHPAKQWFVLKRPKPSEV